MSAMFTYRDLEAWQKGMDLVEACYRVTTSFPKSELYGLTVSYGEPRFLFLQTFPKGTVVGPRARI